MNLTSCDNCGTVLDKDKLSFPNIYNEENGEILSDVSEWDGYDHVAITACPVCNTNIQQ